MPKTKQSKLLNNLFDGLPKKKQTKKEKQINLKAQWREGGRDIAPIPSPGMIKERADCEHDLELFLTTFMEFVFILEFAPDLKKAIHNLQTSIEKNGLYFQILPRGSGKTVLAIGAIIWGAVYGKRNMFALIGATKELAKNLCDIIINELRTNEKLLSAFPEVCYPMTKIQHVNQQTAQTCNGVSTQLSVSKNEIRLPTIEGSTSSGVTIIPYGLTGAIRGEIRRMPDGTIARPDYFLIDDPQTDESAMSESQCEQREILLQSAVLGLAGPGRNISGVVNATIIRQGDMVDKYNHGKYPEFEILKVAFLQSFPENSNLWETYLDIRAEDNKKTWKKSNKFYKDNRKQMDKGAVAYWEQRLEHGAISAIQSAYNLIFRHGLSAFMAEFQNEPSEKLTGAEIPTKEIILSKLNNLPAGRVKAGMQYITAGIDMHKHIINYMVVAFQDGGTPQLLEYGTIPKQKRNVYEMHNISPKLSDIYPGGESAVMYQGLVDLVDQLSTHEYLSVNETETFNIDKIFIDSGYKPTIVQKVKLKYKTLVTPIRGKGIKASGRPISSYIKKPGEKFGHFMYYPQVRKSRDFRYCSVDVNFWKTFVADSFLLPPGSEGEISIFGDKKTNHDLLSMHLTAETYVETFGQGRKVKEWKLKPTKKENHFFDCLVYASAAASDAGMNLDDDRRSLRGIVKSQKKKRVKLSELQKNK